MRHTSKCSMTKLQPGLFMMKMDTSKIVEPTR